MTSEGAVGTSRYVTLHQLEIHYMHWTSARSDAAAAAAPLAATTKRPLMVMWHGLTRTGRDYDELASAMVVAGGYDVVCPDTIGRGLSQWSSNPEVEYSLPFYIKQAVALLDHLGYEHCDWVGTSMGGLIGFIGAATALKGRIRRLVLNDVGPEFDPAGLKRIFAYGTSPAEFDRYSDFEKHYVQNVFKDFGPVGDEFKRRTIEAYVRRNPASGGKFTPHYDPVVVAIILNALLPKEGEEAANAPPKPDMWALWALVEADVLVVRGATSDILPAASLEKMKATHCKRSCRYVEVEGCGHAPSLAVDDQISFVKDFFLA